MFVQPHPEGWREILPQNNIAVRSFPGFKAFSCDEKDRRLLSPQGKEDYEAL